MRLVLLTSVVEFIFRVCICSNYLYFVIAGAQRTEFEGQHRTDGRSGWFKWMWKEYVRTVDTEVLRSTQRNGVYIIESRRFIINYMQTVVVQ